MYYTVMLTNNYYYIKYIIIFNIIITGYFVKDNL